MSGIYRLFVGAATTLALAGAQPAHADPLDTLRQKVELTSQAGTRLTLSPDGKYVVYTAVKTDAASPTRGEWTQELHIRDVATGQSVKVAGGPQFAYAPAWSPDGQSLAFISGKAGRPELWVWSRGGSELVHFADFEISFNQASSQVKPQWSPDGKRVYVLVYERQLPVWAKPSQDKKDPLAVVSRFPDAPVAGPASPAGTPQEYISTLPDSPFKSQAQRFFAPVAVAAADMASQKMTIAARPRLEAHQVRALEISPDGLKLALAGAPEETGWATKPELTGKDIVGDRLAIYDLSRGGRPFAFKRPAELRQLGVYHNSKLIAWSPDSRLLAIGSGRGDPGGTSPEDELSDIFLVDPAAGKIRNLTAGAKVAGKSLKFEQTTRPVWDALARTLFVASNGDIWKISVGEPGQADNLTATGSRNYVAIVSPRADYNFDPFTASAALGVVFANSRFDAGADTFYGIARESTTNATSVVRFSPSGPSGSAFTVRAGQVQGGDGAPVRSAASAAHILIAGSSIRSPLDVYALDLLSGAGNAISLGTADAPHILSERELLNWTLADGSRASGVLFLPPGAPAGKKFPLVIGIYPGTAGYLDRLERFDGDLTHGPELLASKGYAMFMAGIPLTKAPAFDQIKPAFDKALEAAVASGRVDSARICVIGQSFGGYGVFALANGKVPLKCGIAVNGVADATLGTLGQGEYGGDWSEGQARMPGPLWQHPDVYVKNSPIYRLAAPELPLLLISGKADDTVNPVQTAMIERAYMLHGKQVEHAHYFGAGHTPQEWPKPALEDYWQRIFAWLDKHIGARAGAETAIVNQKAKITR